MREYHSPEPIILSVGEDEEVSIADVAKHVAGELKCTSKEFASRTLFFLDLYEMSFFTLYSCYVRHDVYYLLSSHTPPYILSRTRTYTLSLYECRGDALHRQCCLRQNEE